MLNDLEKKGVGLCSSCRGLQQGVKLESKAETMITEPDMMVDFDEFDEDIEVKVSNSIILSCPIYKMYLLQPAKKNPS